MPNDMGERGAMIRKETALTNERYEGSDGGFLPTPTARDTKGHNQRRN